MFSTTQIGAMGLGFPDVCLTPAGPAVVPIPYPNISQSMVHIPNNLKQFHGGGAVHNLLTPGTITSGDEAGASTGVASDTVIGPETYLLGSFKVFNGVAPGARMTSLTLQNTTNAAGGTAVPSPNRVCLLG